MNKSESNNFLCVWLLLHEMTAREEGALQWGETWGGGFLDG